MGLDTVKNREAVRDYYRGMYQGKGRIFLTTLVKRDGFGDAGQLGYLYDYIRQVVAASREVHTIVVSTHVVSDKNIIETLAKVEESSGIYLESEDNLTADSFYAIIDNQVKQSYGKEISNDDYLLFYPYTLQICGGSGDYFSKKGVFPKILCVKEMGNLCVKEMGNLGKNIFKTGEMNDGIGYGVPCWEAVGRVEKFRNTWIVNCKTFTHRKSFSQDSEASIKKLREKIYDMAVRCGVENLYFLGAWDKEAGRAYTGEPHVEFCGMMASGGLRALMDNMQDGLIISGGEGFFAESLGSHGTGVSVLCGHYNYQYLEIAHSLKEHGENLVQVPEAERSQYRFFYNETKKEYQYFDDVNYYDIIRGIETEVDPDDILSSNDWLPAIYLPLSLNDLNFNEIKIPGRFGDEQSAYQMACDIFRDLNVQFKENSWFLLLEDLLGQ